MSIFFPSYYIKFKCIADRCRHSCCVGWEIDVDEATIEKYRLLDGKLGEEIRARVSCDGVIGMCDDDRCPFLDEAGLCRIIPTLGENYISEICREHPRFYHRVGNRNEGGIGLSCEEAARIILSSDDYAVFSEYEREAEPPTETDFNTLDERNYLYNLLGDNTLTYRDKIEIIKEKYRLPEILDEADEWNMILSELEYLDPSRVGQLAVGKMDCREEMSCYFIRFLAYLIFRHLSVAESYENLRARLGFCLFAVAIFENMTAERNISFDEMSDTARIISEEIEYSEDNTASLIFEFECRI